MKHIFALILSFCTSLSLYSSSFDREILKKSEYYQIDKDGKVCETDTFVIQINNRNGERDIYIGYSKGDKLSIGDVWIEGMDGSLIRKLSSREINTKKDDSESVFFGDDFVKYFTLRYHVYPYKICYSYHIAYSRSLGACEVDCRRGETPIHSGTLSVEVPLSETLLHKEVNAADPSVQKDEKTQRFTWNYAYTPPENKELNSQIMIDDVPIIRAVPLDFKYGVNGSFQNWQTYGNWAYRLNKDRDELPMAEEVKLNSLLENVTDNKSKAKILYRYLQDYTRYINVSLKLGGFQTYPASYVSENKYGDCKALTYFMQAMLKYVGIPSYPVLVLAGDDEPATDTSFPFPAFNHVILAVPFDKDTVFLECTSKDCSFGYMGTFTQNRPALWVDENNSHIIHLPALGEKDVLCSTTYLVNPEASEVELKSTLRGEKYEYFSAVATQFGKNDMDLYIRNGTMPSSSGLISYNIHRRDRDLDEIDFEAKVRVENVTQELGKNLRIRPFPIRLPLYESPEKRKSGVSLNCPECYADTVVYELGEQKIAKLPQGTTLDTPFGRYSLKYEVKDGKLYCIKNLSIYSGEYGLTDYEKFYDFFQKVRNAEYQTIYIELV